MNKEPDLCDGDDWITQEDLERYAEWEAAIITDWLAKGGRQAGVEDVP